MSDTFVATLAGWVLSSLVGGGIVALGGWALLKDRIIEEVLVGDEGYARLRDRIVKDMLKIFAKRSELAATREALVTEREHRETADGHRDQEQRRVTETVQSILGRIDGLEKRLEAADRGREREVAELREEVRTGFAKMEAVFKAYSRDRGER